jgi:hypothetical protein
MFKESIEISKKQFLEGVIPLRNAVEQGIANIQDVSECINKMSFAYTGLLHLAECLDRNIEKIERDTVIFVDIPIDRK